MGADQGGSATEQGAGMSDEQPEVVPAPTISQTLTLTWPEFWAELEDGMLLIVRRSGGNISIERYTA